MIYNLEIKPTLDKKLQKLIQKDKKQYEIIIKKSNEIRRNPNHYKNLRKPLQNLKRVHIDSHFVLIFSINEKEKVVILEDLDHHNKIYL